MSVGPKPAPPGTMCQGHREVQAAYLCKRCGAPSCPTCDFTFPNGVHLCPECATAPQARLSTARMSFVIGSLAIAGWSTLGIGLLLSGAFAPMMMTDPMSFKIISILIGLFIMLPAIIGGGLGIACFDRRLGNPALVWVAAIWNTVLVCVVLLLTLIGIAGD
jgi:hypothetical protein